MIRTKLNGRATPEYDAYKNAKKRCTNPNDPRYAQYGGRGIRFLFMSFYQFIQHIGPRPSRIYSLDRIDNDGNYELGNVRWTTPSLQRSNRRPRSKKQMPEVVVFVRHSANCEHHGDESYQHCSCHKHLRWSQNDKQHRKSANTRSWKQAEALKQQLEAQFVSETLC